MLAKQGKAAEKVTGRAAIAATFEQSAFRLDYLTEPTLLLDLGLDVRKVDVVEKARAEDEAFVVAYPYYNVNGALAQALSESTAGSSDLAQPDAGKMYCPFLGSAAAPSFASLEMRASRVGAAHCAPHAPAHWLASCAEIIEVAALWDGAVAGTARPLVVFNGELDRMRQNYYPPFIYRKLAQISKDFIPKVEAAYYIHNFKGTKPACLFRQYPGPWQVLRRGHNGAMQVRLRFVIWCLARELTVLRSGMCVVQPASDVCHECCGPTGPLHGTALDEVVSSLACAAHTPQLGRVHVQPEREVTAV